jgi:hypothetical protein
LARNRKTLNLCLLFFFSLFIFSFSGSLSADDGPVLIWLVIDQLSLKDITYATSENIDFLQRIGAFALMNVRTAGLLQAESTYLSIGAGNRSIGSIDSHIGENTGKGVLNRNINALKEINHNIYYNSEIGLLGSICRDKGRIISVLGNSDTIKEKKRTIVSMIMDDNGFVPLGNVSRDLIKEINEPWGYISDWEEIKKIFLQYINLSQIIVIETGDISRIEDYSVNIGMEELIDYKKNVLKRIDNFIGFILDNIDIRETQLGIIIPGPAPEEVKEGKKLSWVLLAGRDINHGWLISERCKREGIILLADLHNAFLQGADIDTNEYSIKTINKNLEWNDIKKLNDKISVISIVRPPFIQGFIVLQLIIIVMSIITVIWRNKFSGIIGLILEYLLLSLILMPINFLIISIFYFSSIYYYLIILIILSIIDLIIILKISKRLLNRIVLISLMLVITIIIDLFNNYYLMADSILGYSSIIGARFYGLGNEYMGLFIGGTLIAYMGILDIMRRMRYKRIFIWHRLTLALFFIVIFFIGASNLGANFGGAITAIFTMLTTWIYMQKYPLNIKRICFIILFTIGFISIIIYLDYSNILGNQSHIGKAFERILRGDFSKIKEIFFRKLFMNLKLLKWTIWTRVLLGFIIYLIFLFHHPGDTLKEIMIDYPYISAGFYGSLLGSIVTMIVNDSGVVAAATILFFPVFSLLALYTERFKEIYKKTYN